MKNIYILKMKRGTNHKSAILAQGRLQVHSATIDEVRDAADQALESGLVRCAVVGKERKEEISNDDG